VARAGDALSIFTADADCKINCSHRKNQMSACCGNPQGVSVQIFLKCAELQAKSLNREPPPGNYHNRIFGSTDFFIASAPNGQRTAAAGCDPNPRSGASEALAPQRVVCLSLCVRPEKPPRLTEPLRELPGKVCASPAATLVQCWRRRCDCECSRDFPPPPGTRSRPDER